jgi:hypothetical protein
MSFRLKLILNLILWGVLGGAIIGLPLFRFLPSYYSPLFLEMLLGFIVLETLIISWVELKSRSTSDKKLALTYLGIMVVKMLLALMVIVTYALLAQSGIRAFSLTFISLYLLFLGLESWTFIKIEKNLKKRLNNR